MCSILTEYNKELHERMLKAEGFVEGFTEGVTESYVKCFPNDSEEERNKRIAVSMKIGEIFAIVELVKRETLSVKEGADWLHISEAELMVKLKK